MTDFKNFLSATSALIPPARAVEQGMGEQLVRRRTTVVTAPGLKDHERGLVISAPIKVLGPEKVQATARSTDPQELRFALLFWDRLVRPNNRLFPLIPAENAEEKYLREEDIL
jgi:hypothetical protein